MCGIVGYAGNRNARNVIVTGLRRLEYRGYDSAGIAELNSDNSAISLTRAVGKISDLATRLEQHPEESTPATLAVGHTRWATHGAPTENNAHPHMSQNGAFALVHNGIIENYLTLRQHLIQQGFSFNSETDSEVIVHLIEQCYEGDLTRAVAAALEQLQGTYGIAVISSHHPDTIVAARKGSPIVVGVCPTETIVASDISAIVQHTNQVIFLNDGDIVTATGEDIDIVSAANVPVARETTHIDWDVGEIEKGGYEHFMLKEIHEQPEAISNATRGRLLPKDGTTKLSGMQMTPADLAHIDRLLIAACGTSLYAGMVGEYLFEDFADISTEVHQAAEFRYRNPIIERDTCLIAISQSGETADTLAAVREAIRKGADVLGICNVVGSTIAREAGHGVYLHAGPEIGVASTKAFTCQVAVLALMAITAGRTRRLSLNAGTAMVREIERLPDLVRAVITQEEKIKQIAKNYAKAEDFFFLGRGYMYPAALEGALKLKEISYIHAEGYHAAELKHGPIALLCPEVPVVGLVPDIQGKDKTISNLQECAARKSPVIAIATEGDKEIEQHCNDVIYVPRCAEFLSPIPVVVAEQIFAYYIARERGCAIDQPRNLAKSVTVE